MGKFSQAIDKARADEARTRDGIDGQIIVNTTLSKDPETGAFVVEGGGIQTKSFDRADAIYRHQEQVQEAILKGDITPHQSF